LVQNSGSEVDRPDVKEEEPVSGILDIQMLHDLGIQVVNILRHWDTLSHAVHGEKTNGVEVHSLACWSGKLFHASNSDEGSSTIDMITPSSQRAVVERCFEHAEQINSSEGTVGLDIVRRGYCPVGHLDGFEVPARCFALQTSVHVEVGYTGYAQSRHGRRDERVKAMRRQMLLILERLYGRLIYARAVVGHEEVDALIDERCRDGRPRALFGHDLEIGLSHISNISLITCGNGFCF
jgi:hypothetical protein